MYKSYKYRLYPTDTQKVLLAKHFGCVRFIYNLALETKKAAWEKGVNLSKNDLSKQLTELKKEYSWLKEVDSQSLQQSLAHLDSAYANFFKGRACFPVFKSKNDGCSFTNPHGPKIKIADGKLLQAKFMKSNGIKIVIDREFIGEIKSTTISKTSTDKYFVSMVVDDGIEKPIKFPVIEQTTTGIDLGIKSFIVTSDGLKIDNPKHLKKELSHLKYLTRQHSKKKKGSINKNKYRLKLALCHEKITNQRKDFLQKLSTKLIKNHDTLCFEALQITNMVKNHNLAQVINSAGWGMFVDMCKYKAEWNGKNIFQISTFQPSTKICSVCNALNHTLTLADREWICASCMTLHDRDVNAAINIKKYSLKNCDGAHRKKPVELSRLRETVKQETMPK